MDWIFIIPLVIFGYKLLKLCMFTLITKTISVCLFVFVEIIKIITLQARVFPHKSQIK